MKRATQRIIRRLERLGKIADEKVAEAGGWTKQLPAKRGLWFHAVWQKAGYFHVQKYPVNSTVAYLRSQSAGLWYGANDYWVGPFPKSADTEKWTRHVIK